MKHRQLSILGIILVLVILLATACASLATPKITITFSADETCTIEGPTTISAGKNMPVDVIGNIKGDGTVGVGLTRIDPDKTPQDLLEAEEAQPPWSERIGFYEFPSDGSTHSFDLNVTEGPIYFLCMTPSAKIGVLGPVE